jgi:hypothetical protein
MQSMATLSHLLPLHAQNPYLHAELAILRAASTIGKQKPGFWACGYIGASKLACLCCRDYVASHHKRCGTAWTTGGTRQQFQR